MRRSILLIIFGIFMNTADKISQGETPGPILLITRALFSEPNHQKHFFLDKQCNSIPELVNCGGLSKYLSLHFPFDFSESLGILIPD